MVTNGICVVIGASHAGVNFAFALRKQGWEGEIMLYDRDPVMPYHRPPLSKSFLLSEGGIENHLLKPASSYEKENITLCLGSPVRDIDRDNRFIRLEDGSKQPYDKLVLATGARAIIPDITGLTSAERVFPLRRVDDVEQIRKAVETSPRKQVVIIGGGYIGLETAASLKQLGASVQVLEREERVLARVTAPEMSDFFLDLHARHGVEVFTDKNVKTIESSDGHQVVICSDNTRFEADIIVVGVGIHVNSELASAAGLVIENGIRVDETGQTNDPDIYAIGDCTNHYNPHYGRFIRLESVQNAVDQAKVAAAALAGHEPSYDTIPWFWSDQYDVKLQMVGLSEGYDETRIRREPGNEPRFSIWYFRGEELLAVDAVNNAKAYVIGTKLIRQKMKVVKDKLVDPQLDLRLDNLI